MLIQEQELRSVVNEEINMLHEEEMEVLNTLYETLTAQEPDLKKIDEAFKNFLFDVEDHFAAEESMMQEKEYERYKIHKEDHDAMRLKLAKYFERWLAIRSFSEVQGFLEGEYKKWLISHTATRDTETALYLEQGPKEY